VFIPKYRREVIFGALCKEVGEIPGKVCKMEEVTIIKAATLPDHVHMYVSFAGHIAQGTLILCDGLKSYYSLSVSAGCTVKDCHGSTEEEKNFFNLNTVNGFHSFIKRRYDFYRGVATKYLNRYNTLFVASYSNAAVLQNPVKCEWYQLLSQ